jgi:imidazolonepropionase-like amidohydrolase
VFARALFCTFLVLAFHGAAAELLPPGHRPEAPGVHLLRGATIIPKPGEKIEGGAILIRGGRIEAVGGDIEAPADARVWEMKGLTIYAGFIDPYLTLTPSTNVLGFQSFETDEHEPRATGLNFYGVTGQEKDPGRTGPGYHIAQVMPERKMAETYTYSSNATRSLRELGFTAGNIVPDKGVVRGASALVLLGEDGPNRSILRREVAQHVGFEVASPRDDAYPRSLMGAIATVRQSFFDAKNYVENGETRQFVNLALEALGPASRGEMPVIFEPGSVLMVDRASRIAEELGLKFSVVASGQEWRRPDLMEAIGQRGGKAGPFIVPLQFPEAPQLPEDGDWEEVPLDNLRAWDWAPENAALLRAAGREVALTLYGLNERKSFRKNLRMALDRGLSEADALAGLTTMPAKICGAENELGSIEKGKLANLTVVEGSYFEPKTKVRDVWVNGRPFRISTGQPEEEKKEESEKKAEEKTKLLATRAAKAPQEGRGPLAAPKAVLVRNATVWTSAGTGILKEADLLVVEGKIREVGPGLSAEGAEVIDASGKHVTAGLIDCHSHAMVVGNVNEGTVPSSAMVRIGDVVNSETRRIEEELAGGLTVANLLHGSANPIGGQNCVIKLREGASPEEMKFAGAPPGIKFALGENVKQSNWGPERASRFPQTRMGVPTFMANRFTAAGAYAANWKRWEEKREGPAPRRDLELETISEIIRGDRLIHCHSYRQDEILMFLRTMEMFGVRVATLQHVLEGYKVADEIARHGAGASCFSDWWAYKFEVIDAIPYAGAIMQQRGVVVSFNSDSSDLSRRLYTEAAKAVKYGGVPETEALKFVTINPAKQLRIDRQVGSLEPGKDGDFVIWSRSPLDAGTVCEQTWIDGRKYFDRAMVAAKTERLREEWKALVAKAKKAAGLTKPEEGSKSAQTAFFHLPYELQFDHTDRHCDSP